MKYESKSSGSISLRSVLKNSIFLRNDFHWVNADSLIISDFSGYMFEQKIEDWIWCNRIVYYAVTPTDSSM